MWTSNTHTHTLTHKCLNTHFTSLYLMAIRFSPTAHPGPFQSLWSILFRSRVAGDMILFGSEINNIHETSWNASAVRSETIEFHLAKQRPQGIEDRQKRTTAIGKWLCNGTRWALPVVNGLVTPINGLKYPYKWSYFTPFVVGDHFVQQNNLYYSLVVDPPSFLIIGRNEWESLFPGVKAFETTR